jgi:methylthioribose-1-phosphate isomerase
MDNVRKAIIYDLWEKLTMILEDIEQVLVDEEEFMDDLPDNSEHYKESRNACNNLTQGMERIGNAANNLAKILNWK